MEIEGSFSEAPGGVIKCEDVYIALALALTLTVIPNLTEEISFCERDEALHRPPNKAKVSVRVGLRVMLRV